MNERDDAILAAMKYSMEIFSEYKLLPEIIIVSLVKITLRRLFDYRSEKFSTCVLGRILYECWISV